MWFGPPRFTCSLLPIPPRKGVERTDIRSHTRKLGNEEASEGTSRKFTHVLQELFGCSYSEIMVHFHVPVQGKIFFFFSLMHPFCFNTKKGRGKIIRASCSHQGTSAKVKAEWGRWDQKFKVDLLVLLIKWK